MCILDKYKTKNDASHAPNYVLAIVYLQYASTLIVLCANFDIVVVLGSEIAHCYFALTGNGRRNSQPLLCLLNSELETDSEERIGDILSHVKQMHNTMLKEANAIFS